METPETFVDLLKRLRIEQGKSVDAVARSISVSRSHLSNVLADRKRIVDRAQVAILDELLNASGELLIAWETDKVKRRTLAKLPFALVPGMLPKPQVPKKVTPEDVAQIGVVAGALVMWDNAFGGGQALDHGRAQLQWAEGLLHADCPNDLRQALYSAVGDLAEKAGFMAFDAFHHTYARELFIFALECAAKTDDPHIRVSILSSMSRQAVWCGRPRDALGYLDQSDSLADQLTATERTTIETIRARAYAKLGPSYAEDALTAVGQADALFARSDPANDPAWVNYYDEAQHQGDTAHALFDLAMLGRRTDAVSRFSFAVNNHRPGYTRSRTMSNIKLATLIMAAGDPREAAAIGQNSVYAASRLKSNRARTDLIALRMQATNRPSIPEAVELVERIDEAV